MGEDGGVRVLSDTELTSALTGLPGWELIDGVIVKQFAFSGFPAAVAFCALLVEPAEAADHHPDLEVHYNRVTVSLSTHDQGGVTGKDLALAVVVDACAAG